MLGTELVRQLRENKIEFEGTDRNVDITDPQDLASLVKGKSISYIVNCSARVKKITQDTYFVGNNIRKTDFVPPVTLEEGLRRTIDYEFVRKVESHTFSCV